MSYVPIGASTVAIAAAAAAAEKARKEEEDMTNYNSDDLDKWEFKIMRSTFGKFNTYEQIQEVCRQEAEAGWEMLEKFDKYRIRFKRRVERRSADQYLKVDPYRQSVSCGSASGMIVALMLGVVLLLAGVAFLVVSSSAGGGPMPWMMVSVVAIAIIGLGVAVIFKKK